MSDSNVLTNRNGFSPQVSKGRFSRDPFPPQNPWLNKPKSSLSLPVVVGVLVLLLVAGIAMIQLSKPEFKGEILYRVLLRFSAIVTDTKNNWGGNGFLIDKKNKFLMTHFDSVNKGDFHIVYFPHHEQGVLETDFKKYYKDEKNLVFLEKLFIEIWKKISQY